MSDSKCAECTRRGRPCVRTSWEALDRCRDKLSEEIAADEKEREELYQKLSEIQARIERKKKIRAQAERQAQEKMRCLTQELEASGELPSVDQLASLDSDLELHGISSPFQWSFTDDPLSPRTLDQMIANLSSESSGAAT